METRYPHNFIQTRSDAFYHALCSKCGLALTKETTPAIGRTIKAIPPCPYPDTPLIVMSSGFGENYCGAGGAGTHSGGHCSRLP